ncbi:hypothetical protein LPJ77_002974 [Coemansia sp. RSA 2523]|nr:hypothetical protein LPJ58_003218 [Coemansia sp. RSA 1591]KAJ1787771.1 hypothetical protein LPJ67_003087 [Coemansia sp. RSA 1938]KAJ1807501.1 hypothetical protein LPJ77_002974 [Coemansia sp. RSA 2523]KAJ2127857.1 hypothetical protein GGH17_004587 [Coemansia sp. RSA 788]KAJ2143213.1 hypothetical protein IW142_003849 [Coemansia sp. RSA 564]KAJ2182247.1 hypothetical protein GGF45_000998 [Coemansia sp. RSA 551]KAJ2188193.1 hypothetical protein EV181_002345 [Coemansia sp. RSA 532]KAJ2223311.1 
MKFAAALVALSTVASAAFYPRTVGQDLCCAANVARAQAGLPLYKWAPSLDQIAQHHSEYMRGKDAIDHEETPGTTTFDLAGRLRTVNYVFSTAGENIANGYDSLDSTQKAWMASPGHKANILSKSFTVCGGGSANPGLFMTVDFASPMDEADESKYYNLSCAGSTSNGANSVGSTPVPHTPQPATSSAAPSKPAPTKPASSKLPVATSAPTPTPAPSPPAPVKPVTPVKPVVPVVPAPAPGKCKRMPKGSIAAGKCKACKKCASSPLRR